MRINSFKNFKIIIITFFINLCSFNVFGQKFVEDFSVENNYMNYSLIVFKDNTMLSVNSFGNIYDDVDLKKKSLNFICQEGACQIDGELVKLENLLKMDKFDFLIKDKYRIYLIWQWEKGKVGSFVYNKKKYYFEIGQFGGGILSTFTDKKLILKEMGDLKTYDDFVNKFESCIKKRELKCVEGLVYDNGNNIVNYKLNLNDQVALATVKMTKEGCEKIKQYAEKEYHKPINMFDGENNVQPEMLKNNYDKNVVFIKFESMLKRMKNKNFNYLKFSKDEREPYVNIVDNQADKKLNCEDSFNYDIFISKIKGQWYLGNMKLVVNYLE